VAGIEVANHGFGVTLFRLAEAGDAAVEQGSAAVGEQVMPVETGQDLMAAP
jgi:ethanolamine ammonia-lyase large subunit